MRNNLATPLVTDALDIAIGRWRPTAVIHHSDPGQPIQLDRLRDPILPSRHRQVDGTPQQHLRQRSSRLVLRHLRNRAAPPGPLRQPDRDRSAIFDPIEGFYNPHRRHSAIGYHLPTNYERSIPTIQLDHQAGTCPQKRGNFKPPMNPYSRMWGLGPLLILLRLRLQFSERDAKDVRDLSWKHF